MNTCVATEVWFPLSAAQRSRWFLYQMDTANQGNHNNGFSLRLHGDVDVEKVAHALRQLVGRHPMLRARFRAFKGEPEQSIGVSRDVSVVETDMRGVELSLLKQHLLEDCRIPFKLDNPPLIRAHLYQVAAAEYVFLLVFDHIVGDGWSYWQIIDELGQLLAQPDASESSNADCNYLDYVTWQRNWLTGNQAKAQSDFWMKTCGDDLPSLQLPTDRPRPSRSSRKQASFSVQLSKSLSAAVAELARTTSGSIYTTLLTAYAILLHRCSGQDDIIIGSPMPGRTTKAWDKVVGDFVNPIAIRTHFEDGKTVIDVLRAVRNATLRGMENQDLPFVHLVNMLPGTRDRKEHPVFQTMFIFQKARHGSELLNLWSNDGDEVKYTQWGGFDASAFPFYQSGAEGVLPVALEALELDGGLRCDFRYDVDRYDIETIERLAGYLVNLLTTMVDAPQQPVSTLTMLSAGERNRQLLVLNATEHSLPEFSLMHQLFESHAVRHADSLAVQCGENALSYEQLNRRANQLAHYLLSIGIKPDDRVAVCLERGIDLIVGLLAIMKAGGAYVPLDPAYPEKRLTYMLGDSKPVAIADARQPAG